MKRLRALIVLAVAAMSLTAGVHAASAVYAIQDDWGTGAVYECGPGYSVGVLGLPGTTGFFMDGCTVQLKCAGAAPCRVSSRSTTNTQNWVGHWAANNSRIRYINTAGAVTGWRDHSCTNTNYCTGEDETSINPGESASVQCNGTRQNAPNMGGVRCMIVLTHTNCAGADTPVYSQATYVSEAAITCLIDMARSQNGGLAALPRNPALVSSAEGHADAAVARPWWRANADPHTNPYTGSHDIDRMHGAGYCRTSKESYYHEIAYTGYPNPTPRQAVTWWMTHLGPDGTINTNGHRAAILDRHMKELGAGVRLGSADPDHPGNGGTFVVDMGMCMNW
jgi:uncharacterized protein YkwD